MKNKITYSKGSLLIISIILIWSVFNIKPWRNAEQAHKLIEQDVTNYYCYLPAAFIHHDLTFKFVFNDSLNYIGDSQFWPVAVQGSDAYVIKMTMGLSYMYAPFFGMAHISASVSSKYEANGFSMPYEFFLTLSSVFYVILGFFFLRLILLKHFSEVIAAIVMLLTLVATNLYYYSTTEPAMSHAYLFCLFTIFIFNSIKWLEHNKIKNIIFIGLAGGLITLIRPVDILIFIFPLLYKITSLETLKARFYLIWEQKTHILILIVSAFVVLFPQLLFWKLNTGSWVYYSYTDEHFFFTNPHIYYGLFSYRKGWLLYTPIMFFSIFGIITSFKHNKEFLWSVAVYLPIHIYVTYSWWCWWYGGSFGSRPMIETYALLALPLGSFLTYVSQRSLFIKVPILIISMFFITLNLVQTAQKRVGTIHWDGMTKEAYWKNFMQIEDVGGIWDTYLPPDYDKAKKGEEEYNVAD